MYPAGSLAAHHCVSPRAFFPLASASSLRTQSGTGLVATAVHPLTFLLPCRQL